MTALGLVVCSCGVPLPVGVQKSISEFFPCMYNSCGCANAEMCWRDCCCYTTEQKLAWAREQGVTPPEFLVQASEKPPCCQKREQIASCCQPRARDEKKQLASCCNTEAVATRTPFSTNCPPGKDGCDSAGDCRCGDGAPCSSADGIEPASTLKTVLVFSALKCRGISISVCLLPPSLPVQPRQLICFPAGRDEFVCTFNSLYESPQFDLAAPPPDFA